MKNKIIFIIILILFVSIAFSSLSFAKYTMDKELSMQVYIDKTPPTITIKSNDNNGTYKTTDLNNVIENNCEITVTTNDNIMVKQNEYVYNPTTKNFNNITPTKFESGKVLKDDGYYKITSIDTSGNKTEIIALIDKTPPNVNVQFYKKGAISSAGIKKLAGEKRILANSKVIESQENKVVNVVAGKTRKLLAAGNGATIEVFNETDLRNALSNKYSNIVIRNSINVGSTLYINYELKISPISADNAIRYTGYGNFIVIQSGGSLTLDSIVVDTRGHASNRGTTGINIESNGKLIMKKNSIIDGGPGNTGVIVNSGATVQIHSCIFAYSNKGLVVKGNGNLIFYNTEGGRTSEFWENGTAISFEEFTSTCNINQSNIQIRNNTNGITIGANSGTINLSNGNIYSNTSNGINFGAGNLKISGGTINNNKNGIYLNPNYSGKMTITNVNIHSNTENAIYHDQNGDGNCTILGGSISGNVYLAKNDNYVNTNSNYPTFTVKPSQYFFKRKLVKTTNNSIANTEISKVTLIKKDSWYKYVDGEYIVVWKGCNILVKYVDYFGNVLSSTRITGNQGESYSTSAIDISGYDLISIPQNANGTYSQQDITIEYKYDIKNVAKVTFEDLLSGVVSAKYWYNSTSQSFTGNGTDFNSGRIFENYGYYKVVVTNRVGLQKTLTFTLNKDSLVR